MRSLAFFLSLTFVCYATALAQGGLPCRVGFVSLKEVLQAHPDYPRLMEMEAQGRREAEPLWQQIRFLEDRVRSGQATPKERQDWAALRQSLDNIEARWRERIAPILQVLEETTNRAVAKVARERGFCLVLGLERAMELGLVLYASLEVLLPEAVAVELRRP